MRNTLTSILTTVALATGCSSNAQENTSYQQTISPATLQVATMPASQPASQPAQQKIRYSNIHGTTFDRIGNKEFRYEGEKVRIYNEWYSIRDNPLRENNELNFILLRDTEISQRFYLDGRISESAETIYIPTRALRDDGSNGTMVRIRKDGEFAPKITRNELQTPQEAPYGTVRVTTENYTIDILTININKEAFLFPKIGGNDPTKGNARLNFWLIPAREAYIEDKKEHFVFANPVHGIYELKSTPLEEYEKRLETRNQKAQEEENKRLAEAERIRKEEEARREAQEAQRRSGEGVLE